MVLVGVGGGFVAEDEEGAEGDGVGAAVEQVGVRCPYGRAGADGVVDEGEAFAADESALGGGDVVLDGEEAGGVGRLEAFGVDSGDLQFGGEEVGELGAAGLGAADYFRAMRREAAGEGGDEGAEFFGVPEEAVELEPLFAVVA